MRTYLGQASRLEEQPDLLETCGVEGHFTSLFCQQEFGSNKKDTYAGRVPYHTGPLVPVDEKEKRN